MSCRIIQGDCREVLKRLPDNSVHVCVTSPPYWSLRSYLPDDHPDKRREIGMEPTLGEYVEALTGVFEEIRRVLHPLGSLWLNLGDCYAKESGIQHRSLQRDNRGGFSNTRNTSRGCQKFTRNSGVSAKIYRDYGDLKPKDMCGVPWRVAFALQDAGWWLRRDVVWSKPDTRPESCKDRPTTAHEYLFLLTKSADCFYDWFAVREPAVCGARRQPTRDEMIMDSSDDLLHDNRYARGAVGYPFSPEGRLRRSVWQLNTAQWPGAHTAVMPVDLASICIKASTSEQGCCPYCFAPYERLVVDDRTAGWGQLCRCPVSVERTPCLVLDPFGGTGTTGLVATKLGHDSICIELDPATVEQAEARNRQGGLGL